MLRKLSAALLATVLIAGPAFAAHPAGAAASTPTAATTPASTIPATRPAGKPVKHARKHVVGHKVGKGKSLRHFKSSAKTRPHHIANAKPAKNAKARKTSKMTKPGANTHG